MVFHTRDAVATRAMRWRPALVLPRARVGFVSFPIFLRTAPHRNLTETAPKPHQNLTETAPKPHRNLTAARRPLAPTVARVA